MTRTFDTDPDPTRDLYVIDLPHLVEGIYRLNVVSMGTDPTTSVSTSSTFSMISSERSFVKSYRWKRVEDWHVMDDKFLYQTHNIETRWMSEYVENRILSIGRILPSWNLDVFIAPLEIVHRMNVHFYTSILEIKSQVSRIYNIHHDVYLTRRVSTRDDSSTRLLYEYYTVSSLLIFASWSIIVFN